jgi:mono/diheme cytochrome c family protein
MGRTFVALALALMLTVTVVACGGSADDGGSAADTPSETPVAPADTGTPAEGATPGGPSPEEASQLYAENCLQCHGVDGSGGSGPDIRGEDDAGGVITQIENGGDGMPSFSGLLTSGQIEALAQHVTGL